MLLQKNVLTAYLQPLLVKHEEQKPSTYEDLIASWQAATAALARERATNTPAHISSMVRACLAEYGSLCALLCLVLLFIALFGWSILIKGNVT